MEFNRPANLKLTGNLEDNFKIFKQEVEVYFKATETSTKSQEVQVAKLLYLLGPDGLKLYNTFKIDVVTVDNIFNLLEEHCVAKKNELMEHYKFFTRKQSEGEPFDKYYADLCELIKSCSFGETEDALLRTQIVLGINDKEIQSKLLREDLPLTKVIKYCQVVEQGETNCCLAQKENQEKSIDQIGKEKNWCFKWQEACKISQHQNEVMNKENTEYSGWNQGKSNNAEEKCKDEDDIMENIHRYNKEQFFFYELLKDIQDDIHFYNDKPGKVYITLTEHLNNVNSRVPEPFSAEELVDMEECIRDAVKDLTDLDLNTYLCTGVVVLSEYLDSPEDMFDYIGKKKRGL